MIPEIESALASVSSMKIPAFSSGNPNTGEFN
jgi:hypothetical protein